MWHRHAWLFTAAILAGCLHVPREPLPPDPPFPLTLDADAETWVQETLAGMTLEQRVGQMFFAHVPWSSPDDPEAFEEINALSRELQLGGHIVGGRSAEAMTPFIRALQEGRDVPLLVCADFEAGVGLVWDDATRFPRQMALAATGDAEAARQVGAISAREARACGVQWLLVPVADVNINPQNPIINIRSYGEDVETVAQFAAAYVDGAQGERALTCAKHYPGHGDTATDSHMELAYVEADRARLEAVEFPPFQAAVDADVATVMTSHVWFPALMGEEEGRIPATTSHNVMTGVLRGEMGFGGVICTDSMRMRGVTNLYEPGEAAVRSILAGCDAILVSADYREGIDATLRAVRRGRIPEERIDRSAERILRAKAWLGLHEMDLTQVDLDALGRPDARAISRDLTRRSITCVRNDGDIIPLDPGEVDEVLHVALFDSSWRWWPSHVNPLTEGLSARLGTVTREIIFGEPDDPDDVVRMARHRTQIERFYDVNPDAATAEVVRAYGLTERRHRSLLEQAREADVTVLTAYVRIGAYKGEISLTDSQAALVDELMALGRPVILVALGSPYLLTAVDEAPVQMLTYDYSAEMAEALAAAMVGDAPITGRLPVTLPEHSPRGHGLMIDAREDDQ